MSTREGGSDTWPRFAAFPRDNLDLGNGTEEGDVNHEPEPPSWMSGAAAVGTGAGPPSEDQEADRGPQRAGLPLRRGRGRRRRRARIQRQPAGHRVGRATRWRRAGLRRRGRPPGLRAGSRLRSRVRGRTGHRSLRRSPSGRSRVRSPGRVRPRASSPGRTPTSAEATRATTSARTREAGSTPPQGDGSFAVVPLVRSVVLTVRSVVPLARSVVPLVRSVVLMVRSVVLMVRSLPADAPYGARPAAGVVYGTAAAGAGYMAGQENGAGLQDPAPPLPGQYPPPPVKQPRRPRVKPTLRSPWRRRRSRRAARGGRQAQLTLARLEPWSVMKFSFVISLVAFIVLFVAVAVLYAVLSGLGVFDALQRTIDKHHVKPELVGLQPAPLPIRLPRPRLHGPARRDQRRAHHGTVHGRRGALQHHR